MSCEIKKLNVLSRLFTKCTQSMFSANLLGSWHHNPYQSFASDSLEGGSSQHYPFRSPPAFNKRVKRFATFQNHFLKSIRTASNFDFLFKPCHWTPTQGLNQYDLHSPNSEIGMSSRAITLVRLCGRVQQNFTLIIIVKKKFLTYLLSPSVVFYLLEDGL